MSFLPPPPIPPQEPLMSDPLMPPPGAMPMDPMMGQPMDPMMGPPMPEPEPEPEIWEQPTNLELAVTMLHDIVDQKGVAFAKEVVAAFPENFIEDIILAVSGNHEETEFILSLVPQEEGPVYPKWFRVPSQPDKTLILDVSQKDRNEWEDVRQRIEDDLKFYHMEQSSTYPDYDKDVDQQYISSAMSDEARAIASMAGSVEPSYEIPYSKPSLENVTQMCEDALYAWDQDEAYRHLAAGNGPFWHDVATYLVTTGYVCWRVALDPSGGDQWFRSTLLNPATVCPVWDDRGLLRVTRHYVDTVANVIADYDNGDGKVEKKLLNVVKSDEGEQYTMTDSVTVVTYHDRWWYAVYADEVEIIPPTAHRYGFVPYVIRGSGLGEPQQLQELAGDYSPRIGGQVNTRSRIVYKNVSYFHFRKKMHAQKEMVLSKLLTLWGKADKPAWLIYQDEFAEGSGTPTIDDRPGKINPLKMNHEQLAPMMADANPTVFGPLIGSMQQDDASNRLSPAFFGISDSANQSGNALEGLYEAGKDKIAVYIKSLEGFYSERATMLLRLWRDWGHLIENEDDGSFGSIQISYQKRRAVAQGLPPAFELTPGIVKQVSLRVKADLTHLRLQNLAPLGNAAAIWMQIGAMSAREAMELRGVKDPDAVIAERRYEEIMNDEDLRKVTILRDLKQRDPELAELYEKVLKKAKESSGGGPPGLSGPNTSAMDLSALGMSAQGPTGRPPGATSAPPPPPGTSPF